MVLFYIYLQLFSVKVFVENLLTLCYTDGMNMWITVLMLFLRNDAEKCVLCWQTLAYNVVRRQKCVYISYIICVSLEMRVCFCKQIVKLNIWNIIY